MPKYWLRTTDFLVVPGGRRVTAMPVNILSHGGSGVAATPEELTNRNERMRLGVKVIHPLGGLARIVTH